MHRPILVVAGSPGFTWPDWLVLAGYFLMLAATGVWLSRRKQRDLRDYFLAGRSMPAWAVAISVLATAQSAATFIGAPQMAYHSDLTYLSANLGQILAGLIVAIFFIPLLYRCGASTVYELLEVRVGAPARVAASWMFMVGRVFASGARLFIGALAGSMILFGDIQAFQVCTAIGAVTCIGVVYTLAGGIRSVIWTDVIQAVVYVGAAVVALVVLMMQIPVGTDQILKAWHEGMPNGSSKLRMLQMSFGGLGQDHTFTLWTAVIGFTLLNVGFYGTDQDAMQRMLTCRSAAHGVWSMIGAILVGIPVTLLFMLVGLLLWIFYTQSDLMGNAVPSYQVTDSAKVFLLFILREMRPGLRGLMMAGLIAAGLSSLNSALNALASSFVNDFYRKRCPQRTEKHYLWMGQFAVVCWGAVVGSFAAFCVLWYRRGGLPLIDFALLVMAFAYAGLVAVFLTVLFTRRGSNVTVIAALIGGFLMVVLLQPSIWQTDCYLLVWAVQHAGADGLANLISCAAELPMAFPWQLTIATGFAILICCVGRRPITGSTRPDS